jgi:hypothetical protein
MRGIPRLNEACSQRWSKRDGGALEQLDDRIEELKFMLWEAQAQRRELMRR